MRVRLRMNKNKTKTVVSTSNNDVSSEKVSFFYENPTNRNISLISKNSIKIAKSQTGKIEAILQEEGETVFVAYVKNEKGETREIGLIIVDAIEKCFDNGEIDEILSWLEDYIEFISWERLSDSFDEIIQEDTIIFECFHQETFQHIMKSDKTPKDKWCAFVSAFSHNVWTHEFPEGINEFIDKKPGLDELNCQDDCYFESSFSYLDARFPFINEYYFTIKPFDDKNLKHVVSILNNNESGKTIGEMTLDKNPWRINTKIEKLDVVTIYCSLMQFDNLEGSNFIKSIEKNLTKEQFVELIYCLNSYYFSGDYKEIAEFQYERIIKGLKMSDKWKIDKFEGIPTHSFYSSKTNYSRLMSDEERKDMLNIFNINSRFSLYVQTSLFLFKLFTNHRNSFIDFAKNYEKCVDAYCDIVGQNNTFSNNVKSQNINNNHVVTLKLINDNYVVILKRIEENERVQKLFMNFLQDPSIPFSMLMYVTNAIDENDN